VLYGASHWKGNSIIDISWCEAGFQFTYSTLLIQSGQKDLTRA